jgi:HD-GYP domain-containing protein (c-di-GMP phosphodiesterase class II)
MTNNRPYRKAVHADEAIHELRRNAGTQFDGRLVEAFIQGLAQRKIVTDVG